MDRVVIVGGGRSGLYFSYILAKKFGGEIVLFERNLDVGFPKGTDIVSRNLEAFIKIPKRIVVNRIKGAVFYFEKSKVKVGRNRIRAYVLNHYEFEKYLKELAERRGVNLMFRRDVVKVRKNFIIVRVKNHTEKFQFDKIVGCDGFFSKVRSDIFGIKEIGDYYLGCDILVSSSRSIDKSFVYIKFNDRGGFNWVVPESENKWRVGFFGYKNRISKYFVKNFFSYIEKLGRIERVIFRPIPLYNPKIRWENGNTYLLGDSALMVKATTGGGTIPSFIGANFLTRAIIDNVSFEEISKPLRCFLKKQLLLKKFLDRISNKEKIFLLKLFNPILEAFGDMDFGFKFFRKIER